MERLASDMDQKWSIYAPIWRKFRATEPECGAKSNKYHPA